MMCAQPRCCRKVRTATRHRKPSKEFAVEPVLTFRSRCVIEISSREAALGHHDDLSGEVISMPRASATIRARVPSSEVS